MQLKETREEAYYAECPYKCNTAAVSPQPGGSSNNPERVKFKLIDVPEDAQIKRYSDSQCMSFFSNNLAAAQGGAGQASAVGAALNGRGTYSSASKSMASGFKWSINNRALGPALPCSRPSVRRS